MHAQSGTSVRLFVSSSMTEKFLTFRDECFVLFGSPVEVASVRVSVAQFSFLPQ